MNYQNKVRGLRNEIIAEFHKIKDRPEGWLPHTVFVEDENVDCSEIGAPVYNQYKLLDYLPDGECQLLNVITGEEETGALCEIEIDWLVTVLNWYGELTGKQIKAEKPQELYVLTFPIELGRSITDDELLSLWRNNEGEIKSYMPNTFAALINDEMFDETHNYVRFINI